MLNPAHRTHFWQTTRSILCLHLLLLVSTSQVISQSDIAGQRFDEGYRQYEDGNYEEAIKQYSLAISADPQNAEFYYHRGVCNSLLKQNEQAIDDYDKAISIEEDYQEAYFERAYSYYVLDKNQEALIDYDRSIELRPDYGPAFLNRGSVKYDLDDLDGACQDWRKALDLNVDIAGELIKTYCGAKS